MSIRIRILNAFIFASLLFGCSLAQANDRTTEEFEAYAARRMANVDKEQLAEFAKLVDANDDGEISAAEFANRITAYQQVFKNTQPKIAQQNNSGHGHGLPENWQTDFEKAQALSAESGKPIVAMFSASWCGPCKTMIANVFPTDEAKEALEAFVPVYVDSEKQPALASKNAIDAYPTFVCFDVDGVAVERQTGSGSVEKFTEMLTKFKAAEEDNKAE